jgi:flagellar biosynthesis GTPase FlhF
MTLNPQGMSQGVISPAQAFFGAVASSLPQSIDPNALSPPGMSQGVISPKQAFFGSAAQQLPQSIDPNAGRTSTPQTQTPQLQTQPAVAAQTSQQQQAAQQGASSSQTRRVTINNPDGSISSYNIDPRYSYISQTGRFEHDFWTAEGQKERILNSLETINPFRLTSTAIGGKYVPVASEAVTGLVMALNLTILIRGGASIFTAVASMNKVGALAVAANGAKTLASTIPEAAGTATKAAAAGEVILNTKTPATGINAVTQALFHTILGRSTLGGIVVSVGLAGSTQIRKEVSDYIKDSGELAVKLREAGLNDLADELNKNSADLKNGFDVVLPYIPYLGKNIEGNKIQGYIDDLNAANLKYEAAVKAEKEQEILAAQQADQAAAELKRQQELSDLADKRAYEEKTLAEKKTYEEGQAAEKQASETAQTAEQRAYNEEQKAAQQAYNEAQTAEQRAYNEQEQVRQAEAQARAEGTATETAEGSTLTFGLLSTGGAVEFVDKDKAAKVYFGKVYEELTPEQKMLLNLLKGE